MEIAESFASGEKFPYKDIGDRLCQVRELTKLNKKDFADSIGVNAVSYARYEEGLRSDVAAIKRVHLIYGVDLNWLLDGKGSMYAHPPKSDLSSAEELLPYAESLSEKEALRLAQLILNRIVAA